MQTGCVIIDKNGESLVGKITKIITNTVVNAELIALLHGLLMTQTLNLPEMVISAESKEVISLLNNIRVCDSNILIECRELLRKLGGMMQYEPREKNIIADKIEGRGRAQSEGFNFVEELFTPLFFCISCFCFLQETITSCRANYAYMRWRKLSERC